MINRYSLADYTVKIQLPTNLSTTTQSLGGKIISVGGPGEHGEGSFLGSITVARNNDTWSTEGDPTGSWVHTKSLNKTGTVTLSISQITDVAIQLQMLAAVYEATDISVPGVTITISNGENLIVTAEDCYLARVPELDMGGTAAMRNFGFTAGRVTFNQEVEWPTTQSN